MNIYLVEQDENMDYDSFVCYANNEKEASELLPSEEEAWNSPISAWCSSPSKTTVTLLGYTNQKEVEVILASFNSG